MAGFVGLLTLLPASLRRLAAYLSGGNLTDNQVLRANGTDGIQGSGWYIGDADQLSCSGGQIYSEGATADLTIGSERDLGLGGDRDAWLTSDGTTTISGTTATTITGGDITLTATDDVTITGSLAAGGAATMTAYTATVEATETASLIADSSSLTVAATSITISPEGGAGTLVLDADTYSLNAPEFRSALAFQSVKPSGNTTITGTAEVTVGLSRTIPAGASYLFLFTLSGLSPAADDWRLNWTTTGTVTVNSGVSYDGSPAGHGAENVDLGLYAATGSRQQFLFHGTVHGGASGGSVDPRVGKWTDTGADATVYGDGTSLVLIPLG